MPVQSAGPRSGRRAAGCRSRSYSRTGPLRPCHRSFFRKEPVPFPVEAERCPDDQSAGRFREGLPGLADRRSGEWDRGCEMVESAMQLNPNCPGYFYFARCCNAYRQGKYEEVLEGAARVNMPSYYHVPALRAAALGQLAGAKRRKGRAGFAGSSSRLRCRRAPGICQVVRLGVDRADRRRLAQSGTGVSGEFETSCHCQLGCRVTGPSDGRGTGHCSAKLPATGGAVVVAEGACDHFSIKAPRLIATGR